MSDLTKKELQSILKAELKDRPLLSDLEKFATKDDLDSVVVKLDHLEERFDGLENRFDGLEIRFDGLEIRFDGLQKKVDNLDEKIDDMGSSIVDAIERGMGIKADKTEVLTLAERVAKLEKIVTTN